MSSAPWTSQAGIQLPAPLGEDGQGQVQALLGGQALDVLAVDVVELVVVEGRRARCSPS